MTAKKDSYKKPVIHEVPPEVSAMPVATFIKQDFDDVIFKKGYDAYIEKAIKCACTLQENGNALPSCRNCGGTSWIFVNKRKTKVVSQSMNKQTKYLQWSEADRGTVSITVRPEDNVAFMDRITNLRLVSTYSERLIIQKLDGRLVAFTIYPIITPTEVYIFDKSDKPLRQIFLSSDFTIEDNKIILDYTKFKNLNVEQIAVAVRYTHWPQYHVLDITRDAMSNLGAEHSCDNPEVNDQYAPLPIHFVAKKAHYVFDAPSSRGQGLYDNTYIPNNTMAILSESLPFTLDYWILRSNAQQIIEALLKEGNTEKIEALTALADIRVLSDFISPNNYIGKAPKGATVDQSVWTIDRITISVGGGTTTATATNVKWIDRLTATYT